MGLAGKLPSGAAAPVVAVSLGAVALYAWAPASFALLAAGALGALVLAACTNAMTRAVSPEDRSWMRQLVALVGAAHVGIGALINTSEDLITTFGFDARTYDAGALGIMHHWTLDTPVPDFIRGGKEGFYYFVASVYWALGPHRLAAIALVGLISTAVVPVTADTARRLFGSEVYRPAALIVAITPGFLIWTSQLLREGFILLFLALALNLALRVNERIAPGVVVAMVVVFAVLFTLRVNVGLLALAGMVAALVVARRDVIAGFATAAVAVVLLAAAVVVSGVGLAGVDFVRSADLEQVDTIRRELAQTAATGFAEDVDITSGSGAAAFLPVGIVNLAFGPFPWQAANLRQLGGVVETATMWVLLPSLWRGWRAAGRRVGRTRYVIAFPAALVAVGLALLLGNYGTIVRERLQVTVLLAPLAALGWVLRPGRSGPAAGVTEPADRVRRRPGTPTWERSAARI